jgi:hypothetical protein
MTLQNESLRLTDSATKPRETKSQEPEHLYNRPDLTPLQFLWAVQNDPTVPIAARMDAANKLLYLIPTHIPANMHRAYIWGELARVIHIEGFTVQ